VHVALCWELRLAAHGVLMAPSFVFERLLCCLIVVAAAAWFADQLRIPLDEYPCAGEAELCTRLCLYCAAAAAAAAGAACMRPTADCCPRACHQLHLHRSLVDVPETAVVAAAAADACRRPTARLLSAGEAA
jgi:hypothetical protein